MRIRSWLSICLLADISLHAAPAAARQETTTNHAGREVVSTSVTRLASQRQRLEDAYREAVDPQTRINAAALLGRHILVHECAIPMTAVLMDLQPTNVELQALLERARDVVHEAAGLLKDNRPALADEVARVASDRLDLLGAFGSLFAALADPSVQTEQVTEAAAAVSVYMDDPNRAIRESARLWQILAYRRIGRPDRAVDLLRRPLVRPNLLRTEVNARLQRCLALAEMGSPAPALLLCQKSIARLERWTRSEGELVKAKRAADWTRFRLMREWSRQLRKNEDAATADRIEDEAKALAKTEGFPPAMKELLVLRETIEGLPDWATPVESESATSRNAEDAPQNSDDSNAKTKEESH